MDKHIRTLRKEELLLGGRFDEENAERAVSWLVAAEARRPVVLVGAGFTRNALDRKSGLPATENQAPLWGGVVRRLADDLGICADRYDAPTLCEMYQEALGDARLRDALRDVLDDAALKPGEAHESLATYPCEAIVTTNCLDTLLDKVCVAGWRRVVVDADLSTSGQRRDLIYLHGHRDFSDSWVMTRSQYEDFPRTRPVIVARVRQLLAQHPWLIVGFGMGDPNFHALTRLLGVEMRGHQPLSLALMPRPPLAAERQHWRRLGIEMCAPSTDNGFAEFLTWAFPKFVTQYSPTSDAATAFIRRGATPEERLRRFRQVNPAPIVERDEVHRAWEEQLDQLLTEEERASAARDAQISNQAYLKALVEVPTDGVAPMLPYAAPTQAHSATPLRSHILQTLSHERPFASIAAKERVRCLDRLLEKDQNLRAELAEHFAWGLEHRLFESEHPALMELVAIHLAKDGGWSERRIERLIYHATDTARRYQPPQVEELLGRQIRSLGLALPPTEEVSIEAHLLAARNAYGAFMNADFARAAEHYERAAQRASAAGREFEVWAYTIGQADAVERLAERPHGQPSTPESEQESANRRLQGPALRDQVQQFVLRPAVKHWLDQADRRSQGAVRETIEESRARERSRRTGTRSMRWSGAGHALWKSYRDLQAIYAPPLLQGRYIEPLLPFLDADDVRLVLANVSKPREWLEKLLSLAPRNLSEREERDRYLIEAILADASTLTKSERMAAVQCAGRLAGVLRTKDVPRALEWLKATAEEIGPGWQQTAWDSRSIAEDCWRMFTAVARWADASLALSTARMLVGKLGRENAEGAQRALYDLPWQVWKLSVGETAEGYLELLTSLIPSQENLALQRSESFAYVLFALVRMVEAGLDAKTLTVRIGAWKGLLEVVKQRSSATTRFSEAKRAGFLLERQLARLGVLPSINPADLFAAWFGGARAVDADEGDRDEVWATLNDALETPAPSLVERLATEIRRFIHDERAARHYRLNPHMAPPAIRLLTRGLEHLEAERHGIASFFIGLFETAPDLVVFADGVLRREFWEEDSWNLLKNVLIAACGGARLSAADRDDPGMATRCQTAVLALTRKADIGLRDTEPALWHALQGLALAAVNDERMVVANQAAFAVVKAAMEVEAPAEAALYASALQRVVADARVEVRSALANGGIGLAARARHERIRQAAREGIEELQRDDNAQVSWLLTHARAAEPSLELANAHSVAETP